MQRNQVIQHALGGGGSDSESEVGDISSLQNTPCSLSSCNAASPLNFRCDACKSLFCLSHRLPHLHACPNSEAANHKVFVCPLCKSSVDIVAGEDIHAIFARHEQGASCKALQAQRKAGKGTGAPRCPAKGCKEKLVGGMAIRCAACKSSFCILHRDPTTHSCGEAEKKAAAPPKATFFGRLVGSGGGKPPLPPAGSSHVAKPAPAAINFSQQVRETAHRRKRKEEADAGDSSPHSCALM
jgi:predicted nucleic acid binding AN1-type Zn finger protein